MPTRSSLLATRIREWRASEARAPKSPFDGWDDPALVSVWRVLNRTAPVASLQELRDGLNRSSHVQQTGVSNLGAVAFGFDTNAIFRMGLGKQGADAVDYLRTQHTGPVIVPGQAVQEVWNNLLAAVQPKGKNLLQAFSDFQKKADAIGVPAGETGKALEEALSAWSDEYIEWLDPETQEILSDTLEVLSQGRCSYVPRAEFYELARTRQETKTPPGFKDQAQNHGDFFVWADFLYALAQTDLSGVAATVLVTNDEKPDWSRDGVAHPVLTAEARAVAGVPFYLWTTKRFTSAVSETSS